MSAFSDFACSIARTVDVVGEWWTLLILRDLFAGMSAYDELQRDLGIASNVLAARLQKLRDAGLVERSADPETPAAGATRSPPRGASSTPCCCADGLGRQVAGRARPAAGAGGATSAAAR
jgi:DNA-binding HxlR family transcriptional regulator